MAYKSRFYDRRIIKELRRAKPIGLLRKPQSRARPNFRPRAWMTWEELLCEERFGGASITKKNDDPRTVFESDVDRIVFTSSFRRLAKKTQVHPLSSNDNVHTRLTHSIEVAEVGRSLGKCLEARIADRLPNNFRSGTIASIVQAACLAHDLGNPPFGHAGEAAILHWFRSNGEKHLKDLTEEHQKDIKAFEGNAQGFRVITQTENHVFGGGLRLTYATLGTFLKYPWSSRTVKAGEKFGVYLSEERILAKVAKTLGLRQNGDSRWVRHPLAYLVEAADDICYSTLDLEDAVELKIITFAQAKAILLSALDAQQKRIVTNELLDASHYRTNFMRMRGPIFASLINAAVESFASNYDRIMAGTLKAGSDLFSLLPSKDSRANTVRDAKNLAGNKIYPSQHKVELELGCFSVFDTLLDAYCHAALDCARNLNHRGGDRGVSWRSGLVLKLVGNHAPRKGNEPNSRGWSAYECMRRMLDYLSGMTDNYAQHLAAQLRGSVSP